MTMLLALFLLGVPAVCHAVSPPEWIRSEWSANPAWDDGRVEVNLFDATTTLHGAPRGYVMVATFSACEATIWGEAEIPPGSPSADDGRPAMKMSIVSEQIATPDFPYDFASTVLVDRRDPAHVLSSMATSHDWNGITAKRYTRFPETCFTGWSTAAPGSVERTLAPDVLPLEAVPFFLRAMDFSTTATFRCVPTLMAHRLPWSGAVSEPDVLTLAASVDGSETTTTAAGTFDCYRINVSNPRGQVPMVLWIEKEFPNRLVYKTTASGKVFSLRSSQRRSLAPSDHR